MKFYLTKSELKHRGWTESMIKKLLGQPDSTKKNPYYKSAAPMCLYEVGRVNAAESTKEFKEYQDKKKTRSEASKKAIETKIQKAMKFACDVEIKVPEMSFEKAVEMACESYNDFHMEISIRNGSDFILAEPYKSNEDFLFRITKNFLQNECTEYDDLLSTMYGKTGIQEAHDILQKRVNDEIIRVYPQLR